MHQNLIKHNKTIKYYQFLKKKVEKMPNFAIPLLYRNNALRRHKVVQIITDPCLITGGFKGDIVSWSPNLQPIAIAYPNISDAPGSVILMLVLKDRVESILLTVHSDQRVRLWDYRDGRCLQVSPHNVFGTAKIGFAQPLSPTRCRFVVFGGNNCNSLMLFDIWKMKVAKQYTINTEHITTFRSLCKLDSSTLLAIDSQNHMHKIDVSCFQTEIFLDYFFWKQDGSRSLDLLKTSELTLLGDPVLIKHLPGKPLVRSHYEEELGLLILVFTNQVSLLFFTGQTSHQIILQQSRNLVKFSDAIIYNGVDMRLLILTTREGNLTAVKWNDFVQLLALLKNQTDFSYSYREVMIQRVVKSSSLNHQSPNTVTVQLNFQLFFRSSVHKFPSSIRKQCQTIILNNSYTNSKIYQYQSQPPSLVSYSTQENLEEFIDYISIFTKDTYRNVEIQNTDLYFCAYNGLVFKEPKEQKINDGIVQQKFDFHSQPEELSRVISQIASPAFLKETQIEECLKSSKVTSSLLHNGNYFFGCDDGLLYAFPMFFTNRKNYQLYKGKIDNSSLTFLFGKGNLIFTISAKGRFVSLNMQGKTPSARKQSQELQQVSGLQRRPSQQQQNGGKKVEETSLLIGKLQDTMLSSQGKAVLKVREVVVEITSEDEEDEIQQFQTCGLKKSTVGIQLMNNTILLVSVETGMITHKLQGIPEELNIYGLYFEQRLQNHLVLCDEGSLYIFSQNGRMERILNISQYHPLFAIEQRLERLKKVVSYHSLSEFKSEFQTSISTEHSLLEYSLRGAFIRRNTASPTLYETLGPLNKLEFKSTEAHKLIWLTQSDSQSLKVFKVVQSSIGDFEWWDLQCSTQDQTNIRDRLVGTLFPWGVDTTLDAHLETLLGGQRPTFQPLVGVPGLGHSVSFVWQPRWGASEYLTCLQSMAIMHYYINLSFKDNNLMTSLMFQTVELFTKKKKLLDPNFKSMNLCQLASYTIDDSNEIMTAACNLIISQIINKEHEMRESIDVVRQLLRTQLAQGTSNYSNVEVIGLVVESYFNVFSDKPPEQFKPAIDRVIQGIDLKNCVINPHFTAVLLKQIIDGLQHFRPHIVPEKVLDKLFFIFFHYNTALEYMSTLRENPQLGRKALPIIEEFARQTDEMKKRMKQLVVKAIIQVGNLSLPDFYALIRRDILKLEIHMLYPCSIIDLIRNYIKSSQQNSIKHLPFLIEIILKSLDPNNPNLRKVCHRAATNALHTVCKMFQCVSFHQATQKIALGSFDNQIIIYDLRTAVKWRVLDGHEGLIAALGFDTDGKHLASYSQIDSSLRIWKVGSTGFFGSILGIQGKHIKLIQVQKKQLDPHAKITVAWNNRDDMVLLKLGDHPTQQHRIF